MKASRNTNQINVYISDDLRALLTQFRTERGLSESGAIALILRERLETPVASNELSKEQVIEALQKLL